MKKYAITGATGLVGKACVKQLQCQGHEVISLQRPLGDSHDEKSIPEQIIPFQLGREIKAKHLEGIDVLIHCAYDFRARTWEEIYEINVQGSIRLFETALKSGIKQILFVSTISAYEGCHSLYGKGKVIVEEWVRNSGGIIVRPGLVYGSSNQGMFGALSKIASLPLIPVFDGGHQPLFMIHVHDLASILITLTENEVFKKELLTVAHPTSVEFRDLLSTLAYLKGKRVRLFSIPSAPALFILKVLEFFRIRIGFKSDSLLGLLHPNPTCNLFDLNKIGIHLKPFAETMTR